MEKISLDKLQGVPRTLLLPLRGKALETSHPNPIIKDPFSIRILDAIDHDFDKNDIPDVGRVMVAVRTFLFDAVVSSWLDNHPDGIIVNLGCGVDTRRHRLGCERGGVNSNTWYNIDLPEVMELRKNFFQESPWNVEIAANVTNWTWVNQIPKDKPVMFIAEGLFPYLTFREVMDVLSMMRHHFSESEVVFEAYGPSAKLLRFKPGEVRAAFSSFKWFIKKNDFKDNEGIGIKFLGRYNYMDFFRMHWPLWARIIRHIPFISRFAGIVHLRQK